MDVMEFTTKEAALTPPKRTAVTAEKLVPVMVTEVPLHAPEGVKLEIVGGGTVILTQ